jgi:hypothetical protein
MTKECIICGTLVVAKAETEIITCNDDLAYITKAAKLQIWFMKKVNLFTENNA